MLGALAAPLVRAYCAPRARRFLAALDDPAAAQRATLARIVGACAATGYGRSIGLAPEDDLDRFRSRVPIVGFGEVGPWIDAQRAGETAAIAPGRVRVYEPTSGSSGATKRVPYNDAMLGAFRGLFAVWTHDLLAHILRPRSGRTFMSVSPPIDGREGFTDDREYLGGPLRALVGRFIVAPPRLPDPEGFRDALACALAVAADLEIVSVWNPGYLLVLLEHFEAQRERLLPRLPRERRAPLERDPVPWDAVWPRLQLVSCWTAAGSAAPAHALAQRLPQARMQGKGLLATEAPVTVPLVAAGGCVPLVDEVFLELIGADGRARLLVEGREGDAYEIVITQPGGLLRYRLGDRVIVSGRHRGTPIIEFAGRADAVSDLAGEKLGEAFAAEVLARETRAGAFAMLVPVASAAGRPRYALLTDDASPDLARRVDAGLMHAFRYREARWLGQLDAAEAIARADMRRTVLDARTAQGMKAGDVKEAALETSTDRAARLLEVIVGRGPPAPHS